MNRTIRCLLALSVAALVAAPVLAGGPLANCFSGQPYLWPGGGVNIPFNPDQGDLGPLTGAAAITLTQDSFDVWGAVATATVTYTNAGLLPVDVDITNFGPYLNPTSPDGLSAIVFDDDGAIFTLLFGAGSGILGFAGPEWINSSTCTILEGVSFLNGPSFTNPVAAFDVMVHEFGHYTNLAHTVVNGQIYLGSVGGDTSGPTPNNTFPIPNPFTDIVETMYPFYYGPGIGTSSLEADDIASVSTLYPAPSFATTTGSLSGRIFAPNGTTRLTGVNVIARNVANPFVDAVSAISSDFTDGTAQSDPVVGTYKIEGLTPGGSYVVYVDTILAGGFSTTPLVPLPGPEEFYNAAESSSPTTDNPNDSTAVTIAAGTNSPNINVIFNAPGEGDPLPVGDDGSVQIFLPFTFTICEQDFGSVFINANGNLTFGAPDSDFSESTPEFLLETPRIAGLWDDLNPSAGGTVFFTTTNNTFTVTWDQVPEFFSTGSNTFSITLKKAADQIDIDYGAISATDGLAGVSCGCFATGGAEVETDLGATFNHNFNGQTAIFEQFTALDNDLAFDSLRFNTVKHKLSDVFENNNSLGSASAITFPFSSAANANFTEIAPAAADIDFFSFTAQAGQTLVAEVVKGQIDSVIGVLDSAGNVLNNVVADDDAGTGLLSKTQVNILADGTYYLAVTFCCDYDLDGVDPGQGLPFDLGRYVLTANLLDGVPLALGDDTSALVTFGFNFPFNGTNYNSVFVNSNGNLTFGGGDTDFSESVSEFLNENPRIAMLWDDLSPNAGGQVLAKTTATSLKITFNGVPQFATGDSNTFAVTLASDGTITVVYGGVAAVDGLVGVTPGGFAPNPGPTNLSAAGALSAVGTTYELFNIGNPGDLSGLTLVYTNP